MSENIVVVFFIQVNLFQNHLHHLTHNMTTDCSLSSYFGLVDARIRASDKYLPVIPNRQTFLIPETENLNFGDF